MQFEGIYTPVVTPYYEDYSLNREGLAIMLVEQNTRMALATAQRGYVLELGAIVLKGRAKDLSSDSRLEEAYLGGKSDRASL